MQAGWEKLAAMATIYAVATAQKEVRIP
jgi:hypothetical protein